VRRSAGRRCAPTPSVYFLLEEVPVRTKIQVFISSTYTDLIEERQAVVQAVLQAGHIPAGM